MGLEIERKFLVTGDAWRQHIDSTQYLRQGYIAIDGGTNVRVRTDGERAWITIKGRGEGISRPEFEYRIPLDEADGLFVFCQGRIVGKTRHRIPQVQHVWEIDEFVGRNSGLVLAEIELGNECESFDQPVWLGAEVTADPRYLNCNLAVHPFKEWGR